MTWTDQNLRGILKNLGLHDAEPTAGAIRDVDFDARSNRGTFVYEEGGGSAKLFARDFSLDGDHLRLGERHEVRAVETRYVAASDDDPLRMYDVALARSGRAKATPPVDARTGDDVYSKTLDGYQLELAAMREKGGR